MTLNEALVHINYGDKIKLPEWEGYWFKNEDPNVYAVISVKLKTGEVVHTPDFAQYGGRDDWQVVIVTE